MLCSMFVSLKVSIRPKTVLKIHQFPIRGDILGSKLGNLRMGYDGIVSKKASIFGRLSNPVKTSK